MCSFVPVIVRMLCYVEAGTSGAELLKPLQKSKLWSKADRKGFNWPVTELTFTSCPLTAFLFVLWVCMLLSVVWRWGSSLPTSVTRRRRRHCALKCTQVLLKHELGSRVLFSALHHSVYPFSHLPSHQLSVTKSWSLAYFCVLFYKAQQYSCQWILNASNEISGFGELHFCCWDRGWNTTKVNVESNSTKTHAKEWSRRCVKNYFICLFPRGSCLVEGKQDGRQEERMGSKH